MPMEKILYITAHTAPILAIPENHHTIEVQSLQALAVLFKFTFVYKSETTKKYILTLR